MPYNAGYVSAEGYSAGYVGAYTGGGITYDYELTSHGTADPNSIMADANFASTGTVELAVVTDTDQSKVQIDWQAISDDQLWRDDINTLDAVTVNATEDTTDSATIGWKTDDGTEGTFTATIQVTEDGTVIQPPELISPSPGGSQVKGMRIPVRVKMGKTSLRTRL